MFRLALRNVFRHRSRAAITLAAIAFGVAGLILSGGFVRDVVIQLGEAVIHSQSGHIQVAKSGYREEGTRKPEAYELPSPAPLMKRIASVPGVADTMARVAFSAVLNNGRADLAIVGEGIEPEKEARLGTAVTFVAGRMLAQGDTHGAMVGQGVASALQLKTGDRATLVASSSAGAMNTIDVEVVGIFQSFSKDYDARAVKIPLSAAHELMDTGGASTIVVVLENTRDTDRIAAELRSTYTGEGLEVATWPELNDFYGKTVTLYDTQFGVLQIIILVSVLLSIANSVNMSVFERVPEFGTMRVLGNRSRAVVSLILTETMVLAVVGGVLGIAVGVALAEAISAIGISMPPPPNADLAYIARIQCVPADVAKAFVIALVAAVIAGTLAGLRIARIPIVIALRQGI